MARTEGDLLEDLRLRDQDEDGWIALCEVRGYQGGAQLRDLFRIGRFVERHIRAEGEGPSARWYIVNQFIDRDPSERPSPLGSNAAEIETFAESGGLIIDTASLFELLMAVRRHQLRPSELRDRMRVATGVLSTDAVLHSDANSTD